ncbi:MAG: hypothetical protein ABJG75_06265 [Roseobacter sp.]
MALHRKTWMIFLFWICMMGGGNAQTVEVEPIGLLFDWRQQRCAHWDIVDTPARAWRDGHGMIHVLAGAETSRASVANVLDIDLTRDCTERLVSPQNPDPAQRSDRLWIASVFTQDGVAVEALIHAEYHGHRHPGQCASRDYMPCWRNAILATTSSNGGRTFDTSMIPVATLPYSFDPEQTRRSGYFNPSNMFNHDGWLYTYFFAEAYEAQQRGVCLMRRPVTGSPKDWQFWDGQSFSGRFKDPYREKISDPAMHVCAPLPGLRSVLSSVIRQGDKFLAVTPMTRPDLQGKTVSGIWALQSSDLINWDRPKLLIALPLLWRRDCKLPVAVAYPSLLDPQSTSRMFDVTDGDLWLTYVRIALGKACKTYAQRDLVAHRLSWPLPSVVPAKEP